MGRAVGQVQARKLCAKQLAVVVNLRIQSQAAGKRNGCEGGGRAIPVPRPRPPPPLSSSSSSTSTAGVLSPSHFASCVWSMKATFHPRLRPGTLSRVGSLQIPTYRWSNSSLYMVSREASAARSSSMMASALGMRNRSTRYQQAPMVCDGKKQGRRGCNAAYAWPWRWHCARWSCGPGRLPAFRCAAWLPRTKRHSGQRGLVSRCRGMPCTPLVRAEGWYLA